MFYIIKQDTEDVIKINVPLLLRLLEYAHEEAKTDEDLHKVIEHLIKLSEKTKGATLKMKHYEYIVE